MKELISSQTLNSLTFSLTYNESSYLDREKTVIRENNTILAIGL